MYSLESSELLARITVNPDVMVGKPVIRGMRITVEQILKALGGGVSASGILEDYPELEPQDIQAAILYDCTPTYPSMMQKSPDASPLGRPGGPPDRRGNTQW